MATSSKTAKLATPASPRKYDLVVLGASGYSGRYIVDHLVDNLPTNCAWAIAGRSASNLETLLVNIRERNQDRPLPGASTMEHSELDSDVSQ